MASSTSSLPQPPSRPTSPPLDTLVAHLLAAKRSLACIAHVARANALITATHSALETHTILAARTAFVRRGAAAQARLLGRAHAQARRAAARTAAECRGVVGAVEGEEAALQATLRELRGTYVERGLRPPGEAPRTLADFVHEANVQGLRADVGASVAAARAEIAGLEEVAQGLARDRRAVEELLRGPKTDASDSSAPPDPDDAGPASPVPALLQAMDEHAHDMAANLSSLVAHFDLCVTAIKHTEGGAAASSQILRAPLPEGVDADQLPPTAAADAPLEALTDAERADMLAVVTADAAEVDDVVADVRARAADMEALHARVEEQGKRLAREHARAAALVQALARAGAALPGARARGRAIATRSATHAAEVRERAAELAGLRAVYAGFVRAYDGLLLEVGRRQDGARRRARARREAEARLARLADEEVREREAFRAEMGEWLPVDLWPGLTSEVQRWAVVPVGAAGEAEGDGVEGEPVDSVPDVSASVINRAIKRVTARGRESASASASASASEERRRP